MKKIQRLYSKKTLAFIILFLLIITFLFPYNLAKAWIFDAETPVIDSVGTTRNSNLNLLSISATGSNVMPFPNPAYFEIYVSDNSSTPADFNDISGVTPCPQAAIITLPCTVTASATPTNNTPPTRSTFSATTPNLFINPSSSYYVFARVKNDSQGNIGAWKESRPTVDLWINDIQQSGLGVKNIPNSSSPKVLTFNSNLYLKWNSMDATSCNGSSTSTPTNINVPTWNQPMNLQEANGFTVPNLSGPTTYVFTISCQNGSGTTDTDSVTVQVNGPGAWFKVSGGDVHTNTNINVSGGP